MPSNLLFFIMYNYCPISHFSRSIFIPNIYGSEYALEELDFIEGGLERFYEYFVPPLAPTDLRENSEKSFVYILLT